ncbi:Site-specific DNA recombinase [Amphibacillus marinus]|uniref:Site-specific DNA recombinase n=1 Tax=Amphibacillus marinus TaxID=872970 RepID=A0A1H8SMT6_9BACI|nr:recombinase family protein [Amphibacillus marinus]SEO79895.1 Site-specific DNA recombinase [Amphibacillus marinus]
MSEDKQLHTYKDYPYLIYTRVSTDKDEQKDSLSNQIDICRYWLEQHDYEWDERSILKDEGKSGTLFLERTALQLILKKARNRDIKMVVFKSIHRLARDLKDALEVKEVLLGHNVRVVTIEEGYDSEYEGKNDMKFEMFSMFAAQYPKTLSVSISAAMSAKVRRGDHIGKVPYGYDRVENKLVIKKDEAKVIKKIFSWYVNDNIGMKTIAVKLNEQMEQGLVPPPKHGSYWQLTTINSIIKNRTFCGDFIYNRFSKIKVDGRKKRIENPKSKWVIIEEHHPGIVSKEVYQKANSKDVINRKRKITPWNEFRGLLQCAHCGSNMVILESWKKKKDGSKSHWKYLKCSKRRRSGLCVNHKPMTYEDLREVILQELKIESDKISLNFNEALLHSNQGKIKQLEKQQSELTGKQKRLLDIYLDGIIDKQKFDDKKRELDMKIQRTEEQIFLLHSKDEHKYNVEHIKDALEQLNDTEQDLYHVFRTLIDKGVVYEDGCIDLGFSFKKNIKI